jgi:hypothetical protein
VSSEILCYQYRLLIGVIPASRARECHEVGEHSISSVADCNGSRRLGCGWCTHGAGAHEVVRGLSSTTAVVVGTIPETTPDRPTLAGSEPPPVAARPSRSPGLPPSEPDGERNSLSAQQLLHPHKV